MDDRLIKINHILEEFEATFKAHGGGAEVVALERDAVILRILGHCTDCALAPLTFSLGIEKLIKERLPEIKEVRYTNS